MIERTNESRCANCMRFLIDQATDDDQNHHCLQVLIEDGDGNVDFEYFLCELCSERGLFVD